MQLEQPGGQSSRAPAPQLQWETHFPPASGGDKGALQGRLRVVNGQEEHKLQSKGTGCGTQGRSVVAECMSEFRLAWVQNSALPLPLD